MKGSSNRIIQEDSRDIIERFGNRTAVLEGKVILVTGASGLIGSYFLDTIVYLNDHEFKKPAKVIALQRNDPRKKYRFSHLVGRDDIDFVEHDVRFPYEPKEKLDFLVQSAGMSAPASFQADPLGTVDVNVNGVRWVLEYAKNNDSDGVLYMSSGETYGSPTPENMPTPETYTGNVSTLNTRACYTESKRLAETLCGIYASKYNVPVKIARPFVVYGPGITVEDRRVMGDFMRLGIEGKPIQMLSEGLDTRSYCYIVDAMVAFWNLLLSDRNGEAFNVANDTEEISIRNLAELIHEICGIKESVAVKTKEKADFIKDAPTRVLPDITKIREAFSFEPKIGIKEGLTRTIDWNKGRLANMSL